MKIRLTLIYLFSFLNFLQLYSQEFYETIYEGEGTYYGGIAGSSGGNCGLPVKIGNYFHCAMNNIEYDGSNACGACITVTGPNGSITLQVVDRCPECVSGDIDMTQEAFDKIADLTDGRVPISWKYTACKTKDDDDIKIIFKEGSSEYWTGVQFRNNTHAIINMEYQAEDGNWIPVERKLYNYFIAPNGIPSPMNLRVMSILGEELIFENIDLVNSVEINTQKQLSNYDGNLLETEIFNDTYTYNVLTTNNFHITTIESKKEFFNIKKTSFYDILGKKHTLETTIENTNIIKVNTQYLASGIYILLLEEDTDNTITKKIIIQ